MSSPEKEPRKISPKPQVTLKDVLMFPQDYPDFTIGYDENNKQIVVPITKKEEASTASIMAEENKRIEEIIAKYTPKEIDEFARKYPWKLRDFRMIGVDESESRNVIARIKYEYDHRKKRDSLTRDELLEAVRQATVSVLEDEFGKKWVEEQFKREFPEDWGERMFFGRTENLPSEIFNYEHEPPENYPEPKFYKPEKD